MLKMRLQRVGRKNDPSYRIVVTDSRTGPKSNKHVDLLGSYSPKRDYVQVDGERAKEWIGKGVQLSDTVHNILVGQKVIEGKKINALPRKTPIARADAGGEETTKEETDETATDTTEGEADVAEAKEETPVEKTEETEESDAEKKEA